VEGGYRSVHTGVHESTPQCGREAAGTVSERDDYTRSHACEFMIRVTDTRWSGLDPTLLSVLVANGVPVAGLLAFDVSAAALLAFYRRSRRIPRGLTPGMKPTTRDTNH